MTDGQILADLERRMDLKKYDRTFSLSAAEAKLLWVFGAQKLKRRPVEKIRSKIVDARQRIVNRIAENLTK